MSCPDCRVESFADVLDDAALAAAYEGFEPCRLVRANLGEYVHQSKACLKAEVAMRPGESLTRPLRFFDYGCGGGHFVEAASELGMSAVGMEIDTQSVKAARARGLDVVGGVLPRDRHRLPFEMFDVIKCMHVLEHLRHPRTVLAAFKSLLAPSGLLIIGVPDQASFPSQLKIGLRLLGLRTNEWGFVQPPIHLHGYSSTTFEVAARSLDLKVAEVRRTSPLDPLAFPTVSGYWENMKVQKVIYAIGRAIRSGGHLTCFLTHA